MWFPMKLHKLFSSGAALFPYKGEHIGKHAVRHRPWGRYGGVWRAGNLQRLKEQGWFKMLQLSRDEQPCVYHEFHLCVLTKAKQGHDVMVDVPVKVIFEGRVSETIFLSPSTIQPTWKKPTTAIWFIRKVSSSKFLALFIAMNAWMKYVLQENNLFQPAHSFSIDVTIRAWSLGIYYYTLPYWWIMKQQLYTKWI